MENYRNLTLRNSGYVKQETQLKIKNTTLLIAGCGMGSVLVEAACRIGFERFILADGDIVEAHNLNRQSFFHSDIGRKKVHALKDKIQSINPQAEVQAFDENLTLDNISGLVKQCDYILDTIDFLDLVAITALHDSAYECKKPIICAMNVGFGSLVVYTPPGDQKVTPFRQYFGLPDHGDIGSSSYVSHFRALFQKLSPALDKTVVKVMNYVFDQMEDGKPCPAPQVAPGAYSTAGLVVTLLVNLLNGEKVAAGPMMVGVNLSETCQEGVISLT